MGIRRVAGLAWNRLLMRVAKFTECTWSLEASFLTLWESRFSLWKASECGCCRWSLRMILAHCFHVWNTKWCKGLVFNSFVLFQTCRCPDDRCPDVAKVLSSAVLSRFKPAGVQTPYLIQQAQVSCGRTDCGHTPYTYHDLCEHLEILHTTEFQKAGIASFVCSA